MDPSPEHQTDRRQVDHWGDLPLLPDPLADTAIPGPDDPAAVSLLEELLMTNHTSTPRLRRRRWPMLAAAAAVAVAVGLGALLLPIGDDGQPAAAALAAVDATEQVTSGVLVRERTLVAGDRQQMSRSTVRFSGDDYHLAIESEGSIIDGTDGQFTPDLMEVVTVDGASMMRLEPMQPQWVPTEPSGLGDPLVDISRQLRTALESATDLTRCDDQTDGLDAYCATTTDPDVVAAFEIGGIRYLEIDAELRIEVDSGTGLLHRLVLTGTGAVIDPDPPEMVIPPVDELRAETVFEGLGSPVTIEAPDLGS